MRVKGTSLKATALFIKKKFGNDGYSRWLDSLSDETREIFSDTILSTTWYPMERGFIEPHQAAVDVFYGGDRMGVWKMGRHAAEFGLQGVYKMFVRLGSPNFLLKKTTRVFSTYYEPGEAIISDSGKDHATMKIINFPEKSGLVEIRIAGWVERAMEISGCSEVLVTIPHSVSKGDEFTEIVANWKN
jgi:hypothetical protein